MEPVSLSILGGVALTEGVRFLYGQATELLKRRRDRGEGDTRVEAPPAAAAAQALDGPLAARQVELAVLDRDVDALAELRRRLGDYVDGVEAVQPGDARLLETMEAVRGLLEVAYGQRITFAGEQGRPRTGTRVERAELERLEQRAVNVVASGTRAIAMMNNPGVASTGDHAQLDR